MTENLLEGVDDLPQNDLNKDYLNELVGENKKFKDVQDLAKGKYEADQYVELLKKRQDELRQDYLDLREENMTRAKLEDLVNQLEAQKQSSNSEPYVKEENNQPSFDRKEAESLFSDKIQEYESNKKQNENFNMVKDKLQQRYGKNYKEAVKQQIEDLGITENDLNDMAKTKPKALIRALGLDQEQVKDPFQSPLRSQRTDNFAPKGAKKRTWAYYQELRKSDPNVYHDRKTAIQMQQDAIELGEEFRDGNYFVKGLHE